MTDEAKKDAIQRIVGVEIKTYDSLAAVEKFDEETKGYQACDYRKLQIYKRIARS